MNKEQMAAMQPEEYGKKHQNHMSHRFMMVACCIPMLVIAVALVATGVVNASFLIFAVICIAIMIFMMGDMKHGNKKV